MSSFREPWLFWGSLPLFLFAAVAFVIATRATSDSARRTWEIVTLIIAGTAATLVGYESTFRTVTNSIWDMKNATSAGGVFLLFGLVGLGTAVAKLFGK
jgi:Na+/melibiose symporter-like transporter